MQARTQAQINLIDHQEQEEWFGLIKELGSPAAAVAPVLDQCASAHDLLVAVTAMQALERNGKGSAECVGRVVHLSTFTGGNSRAAASGRAEDRAANPIRIESFFYQRREECASFFPSGCCASYTDLERSL